MNLKNIAGGLAIASTALFSSCSDSVQTRVREYMQDRPMQEYAEVMNNGDVHDMNSYRTQSKLDSVAFNDVLLESGAYQNRTKSEKDSLLTEFNKIAAKNRAKDMYSTNETLKATPITVKEYHDIQREGSLFTDPPVFREYKQYKGDSIVYRKFFEKNNLLDKKTIKHFNEVCKKIKPVL